MLFVKFVEVKRVSRTGAYCDHEHVKNCGTIGENENILGNRGSVEQKGMASMATDDSKGKRPRLKPELKQTSVAKNLPTPI